MNSQNCAIINTISFHHNKETLYLLAVMPHSHPWPKTTTNLPFTYYICYSRKNLKIQRRKKEKIKITLTQLSRILLPTYYNPLSWTECLYQPTPKVHMLKFHICSSLILTARLWSKSNYPSPFFFRSRNWSLGQYITQGQKGNDTLERPCGH